jgi:peroxiredoxin
MRHFKILIPIIIIIFFSFLPTAFAQTKLGGQKVPDFVTSTLDGKSFALMDWLQGPDNRVLILTFFATWCELCDEDLKFFQRLQDQYADQGLRVLCVFTGRLSQIKTAKTYMEGLEIKLPVLMDNKRVVTKRYRVAGFPCTYAIDREGFLRFRYLGCSEEVRTKFERNLKNLLGSHDDEKLKPEGKTLDTNPLIIP